MENEAALYEKPFERIKILVKPERDKNKRYAYRRRWWIHAEPRSELRDLLNGCERFIGTPTLSKYRLFVWLEPFTLPDQQLIAFPVSNDFFFGILHSRLHEIWSLKQGTFLETRPRYTPTTCFETFPFPFPDDLAPPHPAPMESGQDDPTGWKRTIETRFLTLREEQPPYHFGGAPRELKPAAHRAAIAAAVKELNELREHWLNPLEWTMEEILEFPGSVNGPWARYLDAKTVDEKTGVGTVRYPRLEPRDAGCAAKLKKRTLTNLYNERPAWLDMAHKKLDEAVFAAYGWDPAMSDDQLLERLLRLNLERSKED